MGVIDGKLLEARAELEPHGLLLRGTVAFDGDGPELADGGRAGTVILIGNVGGSLWPAFSLWRAENAGQADPLDRWSEAVIIPLARQLGATAYFPSRKPWQPFQQWAMRAEAIKASPLGILIHPEYGLWHGYRGALGFEERIEAGPVLSREHPCDHCVDKPCLTSCPVDAVHADRFVVAACRTLLKTAEGKGGCMASGCIARNACPVGGKFRYPDDQLRFHMAALS